MTTTTANIYTPLSARPATAWFSQGWEGAGFSPLAVVIELVALAILVGAALLG